jgi:hypothetical protein
MYTYSSFCCKEELLHSCPSNPFMEIPALEEAPDRSQAERQEESRRFRNAFSVDKHGV